MFCFSSVQFSSVTQSCPTPCDPMDCSMAGFPVHHQLPELTQIHVHLVGDAIQLSHTLSYPLLLPSILPSIRVFSSETVLCIRCQSFGASTSASFLPLNIQVWFSLGMTDLIALLFKGLSRVFPNTTVHKLPFFRAQFSLQSNSHIYT